MRLEDFEAGVFDLDGVVTRTAHVHFAAWKDLFDGYLALRAERDREPFRAFTEQDYLRYVDGRPRYEGVRTLLKSRGIELPCGDAGDPPERETVCGLGNRKNEAFNRRLTKDGVAVFETTVALIRRLRRHRVKTALVSSSKNAVSIIETAGLFNLFDLILDGAEAARLGLAGKPAPDTYRHALEVLGVEPARAFGVEDAISGVESIEAAGYGLVVGVDRGNQAEDLERHGADIVVGDLGELDRSAAAQSGASAHLPSGLEDFHDIAARIIGRRPAVFLDYDGTLTPIVARPELALLDESMRQTVSELAELCPVAMISGRDRADVERLVGLPGIVYAGSHGFDITGPGGLSRQHEGASRFLPELDWAEQELKNKLDGINGSIVDRKLFAIAVHYRLVADEELGKMESAVDEVVKSSSGLRKTHGKKVFELRPAVEWDKGKAVLWLIGELGLDRPDVLPFYIGDDVTDEDAFSALAGRGISILVAEEPQPTAAHYRVRSTDEVGVFLRKLIATLRQKSGP